jgi:hypothetical protein
MNMDKNIYMKMYLNMKGTREREYVNMNTWMWIRERENVNVKTW